MGIRVVPAVERFGLPRTVGGEAWSVSALVKQRSVILGVLLMAIILGPYADRRLILALVAGMAVTVIVRRPAIRLPLLLVMAAFVPYEIATGTDSSINAAFLGVGLLSALWLVESWAAKRRPVAPSAADGPWLAMLGVAAISILASRAAWNPLVSTKANFTVVQLAQWSIFALSAASYWLAASSITSRRQLTTLSWLLLGFGLVWVLPRLLPRGAAPNTHLLLDAAQFRIWVVALAGSFALYWPALGRARRAALAGLALAMVIDPFMTARDWAGGWAPGVVVLACLGFVQLWRLRRTLLLTAAAGLVSAILLVARVYDSEQWSFDTRMVAWNGLVDLLDGRWLLGLGLASYWHYWRGIYGVMAYLDRRNGYLHFTFDPKVNMHNNYLDVLGQMGLLGLASMVVLLATLAFMAWNQWRREPPGFGKAFGAASLSALAGMAVAGMLGDWLLPFVYNLGLRDFRDSFIGWFFLGGLVVLERTRSRPDAT